MTARAVRNLPWSAELWCRRLRSLERSLEGSMEGSTTPENGAAEGMATIRKAWLKALSSALPSPDDYVKVKYAGLVGDKQTVSGVWLVKVLGPLRT